MYILTITLIRSVLTHITAYLSQCFKIELKMLLSSSFCIRLCAIVVTNSILKQKQLVLILYSAIAIFNITPIHNGKGL